MLDALQGNCPKFLRQTFHKVAKTSIARQRKRGKGHNTAVRSRAFKGIRVLHRGWHDRKPYDEALYRQTLTQRGAERANLIA